MQLGRSRLLGAHVLARVSAPARAGGLRLARSVAAARTPERIVETSTRLARGRSIARAVPEAAAELPRPPGMSEFAARWIFGDGPAEGIPIAGESAIADLVPVPTERPSFIVDRTPPRHERPRPRRRAARSPFNAARRGGPEGRVPARSQACGAAPAPACSGACAGACRRLAGGAVTARAGRGATAARS